MNPPLDAWRFAWLDEIYTQVKDGATDKALDILFRNVDDLLLAGEFTTADDCLKAIDLTRLDTNLLVGVLTITLAAKDKLPFRARLYYRIKARLLFLAPTRIEGLLSGLE